jgi:hypothetical protein
MESVIHRDHAHAAAIDPDHIYRARVLLNSPAGGERLIEKS